MQNLFQQILGLRGEEEDVDELKERQQRRTLAFARQQHAAGMAKVRGAHFGSVVVTEGQQRRAQARASRVIEKREGRRQRRLKVRNDAARATLRGQLEVLGNADQPTAQAYIAAELTARYGSLTDVIVHAVRIGIPVPQGAFDFVAQRASDEGRTVLTAAAEQALKAWKVDA